MNPEDLSKQVSHQTIYAALYALPKGERRKELIEPLHQGSQKSEPNWHSTLQAFGRRRKHVARGRRKTITSDRGKEMRLDEELAQILKIQLYLADPYRPWQRGWSNTAFPRGLTSLNSHPHI